MGNTYVHSPAHPGRSIAGETSVPPLPPQWIERSAFVEPIVNELTQDIARRRGVVAIAAVQGLGGIGKTTLARAVCHHSALRAAFPEGVLWEQLGRDPDLHRILRRWLAALGDPNPQVFDIGEGSDRLQALLVGKKMLLVLDDVWHPEHLQPFVVAHDGSVLITTRRTEIADQFGASLHKIPCMSTGESLSLLARWLQRPISNAERKEAELLVDAVGNLPLAIGLAGALVRRGTPWHDARRRLRLAENRLSSLGSELTPEVRKIHSCLAVSLDAVRADNERHWGCFTKLGVLNQVATLTPNVCARLWETSPTDAAAVLDNFASQAVLQIEDGGYRMHTLLHEVAARLLTTPSPEGLGVDLATAHRAFLEASGWDSKESPDPADNYTCENLIWHLERAGMRREIHELLARDNVAGENAWYSILKSRDLEGSFGHSLRSGVRLAREEENAFPLLVRYALMHSSLLEQPVPIEIVEALLAVRQWTPERALFSTRRVSSSSDRCISLARLAVIVEPMNQEVSVQATDSVFAELSTLATTHSAIRVAVELLALRRPDARHRAVTALVPLLIAASDEWMASSGSGLGTEIVERLQGDDDGRYFGELLAGLETKPTLRQFLHATTPSIRNLEAPRRYAYVAAVVDSVVRSGNAARIETDHQLHIDLRWLLEALDSEAPPDVQKKMASVFSRRTVKDASKWSPAQKELAALKDVAALPADTKLVRLRSLRRRLSPMTRGVAVECATAVLAMMKSATALDELTWLLDADQRLVAARAVRDRSVESNATAALAISKHRFRLDAWSLARLAREFDGAERAACIAEALEVLKTNPAAFGATRAVAELIPLISPHARHELLAYYLRINDTEYQIAIRFVMAPYLGSAVLSEVEEMDSSKRVTLFTRILRQLIGSIDAEALFAFTRAASELVGEWWVVEELGSLVLELEGASQIARIVDAAHTLVHEDLRSRLVSYAVARLAHRGDISAALVASSKVSLRSQRARTLCDTAIALAEDGRFDDAALITQVIDDVEERGRAEAHCELQRAMQGDIPRARQRATEIQSSSWRAWAQARLASQGSNAVAARDPDSSDAPQRANEIHTALRQRAASCGVGKVAWDELARLVASKPPPDAIAEFWRACFDTKTMLELLGEQPRPDLLRDLSLLVPLVGRTRREHLNSLNAAIRDVARWWP